ncbi:hypothetical protein [Convivina praedatoris]|uniref:Uncharacterized protein n=1 Tax=Convivina praedatoris TaxID=2880963 RepID=A0ABM9D3I3_9LACO|nr:hypothetical protein [Convivina sp. LMG 32447]CAH1852186.1 hypothetical protein LMG032447_00515 [Convivina sp. LMG 32447]CAH1852218.1 hypothetical protein R078138_00525 [Convivina sp. LMG 32447]CAH1852730.1 hypothetical protein R077815_00592 [Convivina sp. LMG 32447]
MNKKIMVVALAAVLSGGVTYGVSAQTGVFHHGTTSKVSSSSKDDTKNSDSQTTTSQADSTSTAKSKASSSSSMASQSKDNTKATSSTGQASQMTYYYNGFNLPKSVTLTDINGANPSISFDGSNYASQNTNPMSFSAQVSSISGKTVRVFSATDNSVQTVQAIQQISVVKQIAGPTAGPDMAHATFYMVKDGTGATHLASPNFAGNVSDDQRDVMIELAQ